jgi:exonuclease VII small subunit
VSRLDELTSQLERVAERLRDGELEPDEAADLVEECARLAAAAASELDRAARDAQ